MSILTSIRSVLGIVDAIQQGNSIVITGINGYQLLKMIEKYWGTSRIGNNLFSAVSGKYIKFLLFFAPDIDYIFEELINQTKIYHVPRATLVSAREALLAKTWLRNTVLPQPERLDLTKLKDLTLQPLPYQMDFLKHYSANLTGWNLKGALLNAAPGTGKALTLDTPIRVPNGWKLMRDIGVDDAVIAWDGSITRVTGVYPQGIKEVYEVSFADGRSVKCCAEHLWRVYVDGVPAVMPLYDIMLLRTLRPTPLLEIDLIHPEDFEGSLDVRQKRLEILTHGLTSLYVEDIEIAEEIVTLARSLGGMGYYWSRKDLCLVKIDLSPLNGRLGIMDIKRREAEETQCIAVDHPDRLFVVKDYIVTHNTYTGYALGHTLDADRIIIFCPKHAVYRVWEADGVLKFFYEPQTYWIADRRLPYRDERILIFHYETLSTALDLIGRLKNYKTFVFLDESHNLNEIKAQRTQYFIEFCKTLETQNVVFASGTPFKAMGGESIPLFKTIDPYFDSNVEDRFKKMHGSDGRSTLDILSRRLEIVSFKVTKDVIALDKPLMYNIPIQVPGSDKYTLKAIKIEMEKFIEAQSIYYAKRKKNDERFFYEALGYFESHYVKDKATRIEYNQYQAALKAVIQAYNQRALETVKDEMMFCNRYELKTIVPMLPKEMGLQFKDVRTIVKYVGLKIQGECLGRVLGKTRTQCHVDMVPYIDFIEILESTTKKTVVFSSYVEVVEKTIVTLEKQKLKPLAVYGKTASDLSGIVKRFFDDEEINPLIATFQSLSTAVPLVVANTVILMNSPFREYILNQAVSRVWRLGQDIQTRVFTLVLDTGAEPNISSRSVDILKWTAETVALLTGVTSPLLDTKIEQADGGYYTIAQESLVELQDACDYNPVVSYWLNADEPQSAFGAASERSLSFLSRW